MSLDRDRLAGDLEADEGRRLMPYLDTTGHLTIGVGHNLRNGISSRACDLILQDDIDATVADLDANAAWWRRLPEPKARVLANLCFNMGWPVLATFRRFLAAMEAGEWATAADELRDSTWWGQVGERGPRTVARLTGDDRT